MQDRYSRLEKSENTEQKYSTSRSSSSSRYFITPRKTFDTIEREPMKLDSLQYAQEAWKNIELLFQKEITHVKVERWQYSEHEGKAKDAKMREERWKGQEVPTKPSEDWKEAWDTGMEQQRRDQAMEQQRRDQAMEQQQQRDQAMEQQQLDSATEEQRGDGAMKEVQWEGRKVSKNLSKQRRSGQHSR